MTWQVRTMRPAELTLALDWAADEGWNPGLHDAVSFAAADQEGFLLAENADEPIGCISAVSYGGRFGFIGLYLVRPAWRGRGVGLALWRAGMRRLAGQPIGLDGVLAQQENYRRSGFALAWHNQRFAGTAGEILNAASARRPDGPLVPLTSIDLEVLSADDRRAFSADRTSFLRSWIAAPSATGVARTDGDRLRGWGVVRRCRDGHKIGPLLADDPSTAADVFLALCASLPPSDPVFLDVPLSNAPAVALARSHGMRGVFETARMYAGPVPRGEHHRVYGITTFELG